MANCGKDILNTRTGTKQQQRYIDALSPDSVKLNDFDLTEWMKFAYNFAKHLKYFDITDSEHPNGNWQEFFKSEKELEDFLRKTEESNEITPHLALFVSFVKLLELSKKRFNNLTKRHLDFYYNKILRIEKLPATSDKVHLIFELAKNVVDEKIVEKTQADGGKDSTGKKRIFKTNEELIANKIKVTQLKNIYFDTKNNKIKAAELANSYDGIGGDFPDGEVKWWPFGYYEAEDENMQNKIPEFKELPDANVGFALSSEILELQEGERNIIVTVEFANVINDVSANILENNIEVFCSGKKEWLGPFYVLPSIKSTKNNSEVVFSSGLGADKKKLTFVFQIPKEEEAVVVYDKKIHGENFDTKLPVCRFLINTAKPDGVSLYSKLAEQNIEKLSVEVNVTDVKNLTIEGDSGVLNAAKPFYPFGTQPVKRSNFYINYPELFKKNWEDFTIDIQWKNTPDPAADGKEAFVNLYYAYRDNDLYQASTITFLKGILSYDLNLGKKDSPKNINKKDNVIFKGLKEEPENLIVKDNSYFKSNIKIQYKEDWKDAISNPISLFQKNGDGFKLNFTVLNKNYESDKNGPLKISLNQSFLHELFPRIYALALSSDESDTLIPNEPYTPLVETITLNYRAKSSFLAEATKEKYKENDVRIFHEHPFGQSEEHPYLKSETGFLFKALQENEKIPTFLLPTYHKGGELYIGLENVKALQQVSLLVQVLEGSENPQSQSFEGTEKVEWSVLAQNEWKSLDSKNIVSNKTDNFLKSGIVKIAIPREATQENTRLPANLIWIKAQIRKNYDVVCKVLGIHAQAVLAEFYNNQNELSHLENGLKAESISKLVTRIPSIKSVTQPYNSFGGKPQESDKAYYRRISERLRHKNRAITVWDYENLILQHFPEVHKVKCLNHTKTETVNNIKKVSFLAPGNVLIVVIPDIVNKNVFDIYQPRVSKAKLNEIQNLANLLNSLHVCSKVINPDYEEVKVYLKVKFNKGFDENYYTKVLNDDITRLLSPWAFNQQNSIEFGVSLHKSVLINYVENLKYVDFVGSVKLFKRVSGEKKYEEIKVAEPSNPISILVSAKSHEVIPDINSCKTKTEAEKGCQN